MRAWLYQMSQKHWGIEKYRAETVQGDQVSWPAGKACPHGEKPEPGDLVVPFYAQSGCPEPGFCGLGVVLDWNTEADYPLRFCVASPTDELKMQPWWDEQAKILADRIRKPVKIGTLWLASDDDARELLMRIIQHSGRSREA